MNARIELVSFDVDGTLLRGRILNNARVSKETRERIEELHKMFHQGKIGYEETLRCQFAFLKGMRPQDIAPEPAELPLVKDVEVTLQNMQRRSVVTVILTDNPHPILLPLKKLGFQDIIASEIEVSNGVFTDRMRILGNKLDALTQYCAQEGVELTSCAHVGDGFNDAVVFKRLPSSVAFNASEEYVAKAAGHIVRSDSLLDVYRVLETSLVDHPSA